MSIKTAVASRAAVAVGLALAVVAAVAAPTAHAHKGHGAGHAPQPTPEEVAAFEKAQPAFERHCFRCHTATGQKAKPKALAHIAMDSYPFGGHHADEAGNVVRKVLGAGGGKSTMPSDDPGSVTGDDLARILAWADVFEHAHPATQPASKAKKEKSDAPQE
jgi:uncharacterized membrane protein